MTRSIEAAVSETDRRRSIQVAYNIAHKIEPKSIKKPVQDIMEGARSASKKTRDSTQRTSYDYSQISSKKAVVEIETLEKRMKKHARDLEFEAAARLRDQINELRRCVFGFPRDK
jgi:excinuclease ABC subunit B